MNATSEFTIGLEVGVFGRWMRLIVGLYTAALIAIVPLIDHPVPAREAARFLGELAVYAILIAAVYLFAYYFLGERLLARANPWIGTFVVLAPVYVIAALQLGPQAFRTAIGLYIALSLVLNFAMSYGGCEVLALPTLIFRRRYTVYCPFNAVDAVESALIRTSPADSIFGIISFLIALLVGGFFLLVEDQELGRAFGDVGLPNQWALLLLVPVAFLARASWLAYLEAGKELTATAQRFLLGSLVLLALTVLFVIGIDATPWFGLAMFVGFVYAIIKLLRDQREPTVAP